MSETKQIPKHDAAQDLREAWAELRTLPLGGRGHLADACLEGAAEIERLREALSGHDLCACKAYCGDDGDPDGPGVCKSLPRASQAPLVEVVLVPRTGRPKGKR